MEKKKITIEVPAETAQAFERASDQDRQRAGQAIAFALQPTVEAADELERILDEIGTAARERGLTEEKLKELLSDEE